MTTAQVIAQAYAQPAAQCVYITAHLKFELKSWQGESLGVFLSEVLRLPTLTHVLQFVERSVLSRSILSPLKPLSQLADGPGGFLGFASFTQESYFSFEACFQPHSFEFIDD